MDRISKALSLTDQIIQNGKEKQKQKQKKKREWHPEMFLVACYATLHPALSVRRSVRRSVRPSVTLYFFWVFAVFGLTAPAQMME